MCRYSVRNILLCGVWYSRSKPDNMHTFLKPVIDLINDLYTKGKTSTMSDSAKVIITVILKVYR